MTNVSSSVPKPTKQQRGLASWLWTALKYAVLFLLIYTIINWWRQPVMPTKPELQLLDYQGEAVNLEALSQDTPVLVYFWGSWCSVCKLTSPKVNAIAQSSPYPVVTIAIQSGNNQQLDQYLRSQGYSFTTINDQTGEMFSAWEGQVTPSYVILKHGKMRHGLTGVQPEWSLRLRLWLSSLG